MDSKEFKADQEQNIARKESMMHVCSILGEGGEN